MNKPFFISEVVALEKSGQYYISPNSGKGGSPGSFPEGILEPHHFPMTNCFGVLTDTMADLNNCGACAVVCNPKTQTCCNGACVPLNQNCGACGPAFACAPNEMCVQADGELICVNTSNNPDHCGSSNQACQILFGDRQIFGSCCDNGACVTNASTYLTSNTHCGQCNNDCTPSGMHCSGGHCCPPCANWFPGTRYRDVDYSTLLIEGGTFFGGPYGTEFGVIAASWLNNYLDDHINPGCRSCAELRDHPGGNWNCCDGIGCINSDTDSQHCGSCNGPACGANQICKDGRCICNNPAFPDNCSGNCVNLVNGQDPLGLHHCGSCNEVCEPNSGCCVRGVCQPIFSGSDPNNCRTCGRVVPPGQYCCDGNFTSLFDPKNCGACGNDCDGFTCCGENGCVGLDFDNDNCGSCGFECSLDGGFSAQGTWQNDCCGGQCVDKQSSDIHCGVCGNPCPPGLRCSGGVCRSVGEP
jgi:hypothetical protein